jgi:hypothetical protein
LIGEQLKCLAEFEALGLHGPSEDISLFATREAGIAPECGVDIKRRGFVVVKRTKPRIVFARTLETNALRD